MSGKQAEKEMNSMIKQMQKHKNDFADKTRLDSVDVIIRRKDKNLEPIEPPKKNLAQARVN